MVTFASMKREVLVVDWLDLYGGAEKVISEIDEIYGFDKVYALVDVRKDSEKHKFFKNKPTIVTTKLQIIGKYFRYALPLFPFFVNSIKIDKDYKLIISSSHNIAKGVKKTNPNQIHISYIQSRNLKYIWDKEQIDLYFGKLKFLINPFISFLRKYDVRSAKQPDLLIANSEYQKEWIKEHYGRESVVVYPPVDLSEFQFFPEKEDYYVSVGRFAKMKRFDILIEAFNKMPDKKLVLIGDGELMPEFKKKAKSNIIFPGFLPSSEVYEYVKKAKAAIYVGIEDFGIAPVEAQACGTPVISYNIGGASETIINLETGIHFDKQNSDDIIKAILKLENISFNYEKIRTNAERFSRKRFLNEFKLQVDKFLQERQN